MQPASPPSENTVECITGTISWSRSPTVLRSRVRGLSELLKLYPAVLMGVFLWAYIHPIYSLFPCILNKQQTQLNTKLIHTHSLEITSSQATSDVEKVVQVRHTTTQTCTHTYTNTKAQDIKHWFTEAHEILESLGNERGPIAHPDSELPFSLRKALLCSCGHKQILYLAALRLFRIFQCP